jgi:hypothetical protein
LLLPKRKELVLLYQAKGMNAVEAQKLADKALKIRKLRLMPLSQELGIDKEELGGSVGSSSSIVCTFAIGDYSIISFMF